MLTNECSTARPLKSRFLEDAHRKRGDQLEVVEVDDLAAASLDDALTGISIRR